MKHIKNKVIKCYCLILQQPDEKEFDEFVKQVWYFQVLVKLRIQVTIIHHANPLSPNKDK